MVEYFSPILEYPISSVRGSFVTVDGVKGACYNATATLKLSDGSKRYGSVTEVAGSRAIVQVRGSLEGVKIEKTRCSFQAPVSKHSHSPLEEFEKITRDNEIESKTEKEGEREREIEKEKNMVGRILGYDGTPLDNGPPIFPEGHLDMKGWTINPANRGIPIGMISTGISAIDCFTPIARGQSLPFFCDYGSPVKELAAQICRQATTLENQNDFVVIFVALGVSEETSNYYKKEFKSNTAMGHMTLFLSLSTDSKSDILNCPHYALSFAEYLAFKREKDVLVVISDLSTYVDAIIEAEGKNSTITDRSAWVYPKLAEIYDRSGRIYGCKGSLTQIPFLTLSNDGIGKPTPERTGMLTDGQIILSRDIKWYPPIDVVNSLSTLARAAIDWDTYTLCRDLYTCYVNANDAVKNVGVLEQPDELTKKLIVFREKCIQEFLTQGLYEKRSTEDSFQLVKSYLHNFVVSKMQQHRRIFKA